VFFVDSADSLLPDNPMNMVEGLPSVRTQYLLLLFRVLLFMTLDLSEWLIFSRGTLHISKLEPLD
jgi:hypothetical protein